MSEYHPSWPHIPDGRTYTPKLFGLYSWAGSNPTKVRRRFATVGTAGPRVSIPNRHRMLTFWYAARGGKSKFCGWTIFNIFIIRQRNQNLFVNSTTQQNRMSFRGYLTTCMQIDIRLIPFSDRFCKRQKAVVRICNRLAEVEVGRNFISTNFESAQGISHFLLFADSSRD